MPKSFLLILITLFLVAPALGDVYLYNNSDEQLRYEVMLPNGDTKTGDIKPNTGYGPTTTVINGEKTITNFKVFSESGESAVEVKAPWARVYLLDIVNGGMRFTPVSWMTDNGQTHKRIMKVYNATGRAQTFDVIDQKEMRKGNTLQPGETKEFTAKNGFSGSSGFHTIKFADGHRIEAKARAGYFVMLYNDKRYDEVQVDSYGWLTQPR